MDVAVTAAGKSLSAATLFRVAKSACERLKEVTSSTSGGKEDALVSIVFSAATLEAFLNELPALLSAFPEFLKDEQPQVPTFVKLADEVESGKGSIKLKYVLAYSVLSGKPCDKTVNPYQDFSLLIEARNSLMHRKPRDFSGEAKADRTLVMGPPEMLMKRFRALGIMDTSEPSIPVPTMDATENITLIEMAIPLPWDHRIATQAAAFWACNVASDVVDSILKIVPDGPHKPNLLTLCTGFRRIT